MAGHQYPYLVKLKYLLQKINLLEQANRISHHSLLPVKQQADSLQAQSELYIPGKPQGVVANNLYNYALVLFIQRLPKAFSLVKYMETLQQAVAKQQMGQFLQN